MLKTCFYILVNVYLLTHVLKADRNVTETCVQLYEKGLEAYLENRFEDCVQHLEKAVEKYHDYRKKLMHCRLKCKNEAELSEPLYPVDVDNLLYYERTVRQTLCIIGCENQSFEIIENYNVSPEVEELFEEQKPYEYIHLCYFKTKRYEDAASAAFTYLVTHPDDVVMQSNLKHYTAMEQVAKDKIVNFEAKEYVNLYISGADAYTKKDWKMVVNYMEESLTAYLQAEDECRAQCEGPFDHGWYPDFVPSISNHFTVCLKCKQKCKHKLTSLNGEVYDDLLPSHYHYLQYAYFRLGNLKEACQAVSSYLLFYPDDDTMLENKKYYSKQPKVQDTFFQPRQEAVHYIQRNTYESRIMKFIMTEFTRPKEPTKPTEPKFRVTMTEVELRGPKRFVSDGVTSIKGCRSLIEMARFFAVLGDGYQGKRSPHTIMEKFEGLTLTRTLFLVYFKLLDPKFLKQYLDTTEEVRNYVKDYFEIKDELYFAYTHLVCRSALPESPHNRTDFSHKIHADNCNILRNGSCEKKPPAYIWRDYSAILYLNSDFEGGEFIFSSDMDAVNIQSSVKPKCGRMIAFSSGGENLHGVAAVKKGTRCAIGMWFTFNHEQAEHDRAVAEHVLRNNVNIDMFSPIDVKLIDKEKSKIKVVPPENEMFPKDA